MLDRLGIKVLLEKLTSGDLHRIMMPSEDAREASSYIINSLIKPDDSKTGQRDHLVDNLHLLDQVT